MSNCPFGSDQPAIVQAEPPRPSELEDLIACDLETCGLDEQGDQVLEIHARSGAIYKPEGRFLPVQRYYEGVGLVGGSFTATLPWTTNILSCHPAVVDMHSRNGLLAEAQKIAFEIIKRTTTVHDEDMAMQACFSDADQALAKMFPKLPDGRKWTLLGNSVHFDLRFIRRVFPCFAKNLSHRVLDVSSIRMFCEILGLPYEKDEPAHRATEDVEGSIKLLHKYVDFGAGYPRTANSLDP